MDRKWAKDQINTLKMKSIFKYTIALLGLIVCCFSYTSAQTILLSDQKTGEPISDVHYIYGDQKGISTIDGLIELSFVPGEILKIQHMHYGVHSFDEQEVAQLLEKGSLKLDSRIYDLLPVTVVSINSPIGSQEEREFSSVDRLNHDGGDILNSISGFGSIRKSGSYGFDPVFRGFKNEQLNIVINGVQSCLAACPNRMDPPSSQIAPNMMERVEILKGPHSLRYGNSFGGTVNFISAQPMFPASPDFYGRLTAGYRSNGNALLSEGQIGYRNSKWDISLFAAYADGSNYKDGDGNSIPANFTRNSFGTVLNYRINDAHQLGLSVTRNSARDVDFPALGMDLRTDDTWLFNFNHEVNFSGKSIKSLNTALFGSFVDHLMDNLGKPLDPRMVNAKTPAKTEVMGLRSEAEWNFTNGALFAGVDVRSESASGSREREFLMGPNAGKTVIDPAWQDGQIDKFAVFGEYQLPTADDMSFIFSLRMELNQSDASEENESFTQWYDELSSTQFNPSFSAGMRKYWSNQFSTGVWLGRSQRSGSLTERYINSLPVGKDGFELLGNPELDPEVINQVDLNLHFGTLRHSIKADFFAAYMQNYISPEIREDIPTAIPSAPGVRQFTNIDDAFKTGFELSWRHRITDFFHHQLAAAYTYAKDLEQDRPLPEIPPLELNYEIGANLMDGRMQPSVHIRHAFKQERIAENFSETNTPSFTVINLSVGFNILKNWDIRIAANNLLDEAYYEHLNRIPPGPMGRPIYEPGRSFDISTSYRF